MALSGKYIKYTEILRNVYRDFSFSYELEHIDALEWIGSLMRLLNVENSLIDKVTDGNKDLNHYDFIEIKDHKGVLPCDLHSVKQAGVFVGVDRNKACEGILLPMNYSTDVMYKYNRHACCVASGEQSIPWSTQETDPASLFNDTTNKLKIENGSLTYKLNGNYIFTNFECGWVVMAYKAIPLDTDGFPLIPYEESWRKAMEFEIAYRISFKLWMRGDISDKVFQKIESERNWYVRQAVTMSAMPSIDEWESFKNDRLRLIPKPYQHDSFFGHLQLPEKVWNHPIQLGFKGI